MASLSLSKETANGSLKHMANTPTTFKMRSQKRPRIHTTLLDLVRVVNQMTDDDRLVVATVTHLVNSGQARLTGTFKHSRGSLIVAVKTPTYCGETITRIRADPESNRRQGGQSH